MGGGAMHQGPINIQLYVYCVLFCHIVSVYFNVPTGTNVLRDPKSVLEHLVTRACK